LRVLRPGAFRTAVENRDFRSPEPRRPKNRAMSFGVATSWIVARFPGSRGKNVNRARTSGVMNVVLRPGPTECGSPPALFAIWIALIQPDLTFGRIVALFAPVVIDPAKA
jgi:hypothetical protein